MLLLLDGRDIQSCNTAVSVVEGREVTTIEGLGGNTKRDCLVNPLVDRRSSRATKSEPMSLPASNQWVRSPYGLRSHELWKETPSEKLDRPYVGKGKSGALREKPAVIGSFRLRPNQKRLFPWA
jgi:hypothetical protein